MIGMEEMESGFIVVFWHKGTGEILAHTTENELGACLEVGRLEAEGHRILYALSIFDDEVARYY